MYKKTALALVLIVSTGGAAFAGGGHGLVVKQSAHNVATTLDRLEKIVAAKGIKVVARINHGAAANNAGVKLRPTELLVFGNPKLGSPLMAQNQTIGIDLPMKVLAWEDEKGQTWIAYNDPAYFYGRHGVKNEEIQKKMTGALGKLTDKAIAKE